MITNFGLDQYAEHSGNANAAAYSFLVVGNATGTPAVTDTTMFAEVAQSNSSGGFSGSELSETDLANNVIRHTSGLVRVYDNNSGSGVNLTEIGFRRTSGESLTYHDLIRDDPTNPASPAATITIEDGEQLQVYYDVIYELEFPPLASQTIFVDNGAGIGTKGVEGKDGLGNIDVSVGVYFTGSGATDYSRILAYTNAGSNDSAYNRSMSLFAITASDVTVTRNSGITSGIWASHSGDTAMDAYVAGTFTRQGTFTLPTSSLNNTWYCIVLGFFTGGAVPLGFVVDFVNPTTFVKNSDAVFTMTLQWDWDRL